MQMFLSLLKEKLIVSHEGEEACGGMKVELQRHLGQHLLRLDHSPADFVWFECWPRTGLCISSQVGPARPGLAQLRSRLRRRSGKCLSHSAACPDQNKVAYLWCLPPSHRRGTHEVERASAL
uniref:Uncharacterized protein n=1 Tax=Noctiluca scintillans TaxID=2966 RepID=A0A7S1ASW7_NOCSC|mmetsp:Transcript_57577/g.153343  ORF Transcript_57577/g.153343 Transcript_57577/m.153343 type:complete len:122 (+) Transcript_57577:325-690(+)